MKAEVKAINDVSLNTHEVSAELIKLENRWLQLDSNPEPLSLWTNTQPFGQTGDMARTQSV